MSRGPVSVIVLLAAALAVLVACSSEAPTSANDAAVGDFVCIADELPAFPYPPPEPTEVARVPDALLAIEPYETSLDAVGQQLEGALISAGYLELAFLGYGCNGFAIATGIERIEPDGTPFPEPDRFSAAVTPGGFDLADYVARLFFAPPGYFRQIVFLVTEDFLDDTSEAPTEAELRDYVLTGRASLPAAYTEATYRPETTIYALIYEFEKAEGEEEARLVPPRGRLTGTAHLARAGFYEGLASADEPTP